MRLKEEAEARIEQDGRARTRRRSRESGYPGRYTRCREPRPRGYDGCRISVRPTLTLEGRTFKGLRGWAGKPIHPPLTDIPVAAYIFAAAFDVISAFGRHHTWAGEFFHAGAFVFIGGAIVSVFGGTLVFDYGFNVETAGDSPVWHTSEADVMPGDHKAAD